MALIFVYVFAAVYGHLQGFLDPRVVLASGPLAIAAFGIGYLIDLLIFGLLFRKAARRRHAKPDAPGASPTA